MLIDEELHSSRTYICTRAANFLRSGTHARAELGSNEGGGRLLDYLLVPPLDRALALAEVNDVARVVAEYLELDVVSNLKVTFEKNVRVSKGILGLGNDAVEDREEGYRGE